MHRIQRAKQGHWRSWEIGIDIYTQVILCVKQITNDKLLYSTRNLTQSSVGLKWEGNFKKMDYMHTAILTLSTHLIHLAVRQKHTEVTIFQ